MTYRMYLKRKRSAGYMASMVIFTILATLLVYSCAATVDVPQSAHSDASVAELQCKANSSAILMLRGE